MSRIQSDNFDNNVKPESKIDSHSGFDLLKAWLEIPDQKHEYVKCWLYKANFSSRVYIRSDNKIFKHKLMRVSEVTVSGKKIDGYVSVKEVQAHPVTGKMIHVDLFLIEDDTPDSFRIMMPIKYIDSEKSPGIKLGGFLYQTSRAIEVKVKPKHLVPFLTASIAHMNTGDSIRVDAISFPEGITPIRRDISLAKLESNKGS